MSEPYGVPGQGPNPYDPAAGGYPPPPNPPWTDPAGGGYGAPAPTPEAYPPPAPYPGQEAYPPPEAYPAAPYPTSAAPYPAAPYPTSGMPYPAPEAYPGYPPTAAYPGYPQAFPPAPQPPKSRTGLIVAIVVAVVVVIGACVGGVVAVGMAGNKTTTQSQASASASSSAGRSHDGDLRSLLVSAPSGSKPWTTSCGTDEQLDLNAAAGEYDNPSVATDELTSGGFKRGAVRCWHAANGSSSVEILLFQFDTTAGAKRYLGVDLSDYVSSFGTSAAAPGDVPNVPGGKYLVDPKPDSDGYVNTVALGQRGDIEFTVWVWAKTTGDVATTNQLARQLYDKL